MTIRSTIVPNRTIQGTTGSLTTLQGWLLLALGSFVCLLMAIGSVDRSWVHPDISPSRGWHGLANWASLPVIAMLVLLVGLTTGIPVTSWTPWALRVLAVALPTIAGLYLVFFSELSTGFMPYVYPWTGVFMTGVALYANPRHIGPGGQPGTL